MIDIKKLRDDFDKTAAELARRGVEKERLEKARDLDTKRRALVGETETLKAKRNAASKEIGKIAKEGGDIAAAKEEMRKVGDRIAEIDKELAQVEVDLRETLLMIPNIPAPEIPTGMDSTANVVVRTVGEWADPGFKILDHMTVGEKLGIFDFPRGVKLTGTGFPVILGQGAKLQRALIQYMLDLHCQKQGYTEMLPPFVVNSDSMTGTGQLPKFAEDLYHCQIDDFWLIPTAEVPVTNFYRDDILDGKKLPIKLTAYTPCFRREAGSAGKMTRGMLRVHQFDKVEMVNFVHPDSSFRQLEILVKEAEDVLTGLGLHFRVLQLCSGDMGFSAAKCYDLELWAPGEQQWLEVSSCSCFTDYQARRLNCRFKDADGKTKLVHTLNGSGVALPRLMVALLEQNQNADGSVTIPEVLRPYMNGQEKLLPVK
ncbi:MAG: serine--tRNA ligase [Kiritimatiellae bacterium]|nr:serine--tRNA ligase [Kiritimatiellia bacterium]MBR2941396.1 serine--tRNA ligase [Kiritimatiellia bacterium]